MAAPRVLVPLATGFEEIEAVAVIDVLRRAGVEVVTAGLQTGPITGSHAIAIVPESTIDRAAAERFDMIVLPGGMPGAEHLRSDARVQALIRSIGERGGYTAAICAAPIALSRAGATSGKRATSYPGFAPQIDCASYVEERVVIDGKLVTSRGPGTALEFALVLVELLVGAKRAAELRSGMLVLSE
jgi:4-methyl-5(b-hydroxyethyl)-thiazole monophosphate biosynthesis